MSLPERSAAASTALPEPERILVRYGELALKGGNRRRFESVLCRNLLHAARPVAPLAIERTQGRLVLVPERRVREVARRVRDVFGIKSVSPVWSAPADPESIATLARAVLDEALAERRPGETTTFRILTKRADKRFPVTSGAFDLWLAERILPGIEGLKIRLDHPELTLGVEVRAEGAYVFVERLQGHGGLPVGTLGRALCLLSGGIDSPVAAWMAMKRGLGVGFVTFHSYPFIGESSKRKVLGLARALARWQPSSRAYVVPFADVQCAIRDGAPESYRTVLYRRLMQRIATRIAETYDYDALVTGDSLGQVASQTLENIACISAAAGMTVLRPLIGFDKDETIAIARRIGTFDLSNEQEPDCCSVFLPRKPVIRGKLAVCAAAEAALDVEGLVERALAGLEIVPIEAE